MKAILIALAAAALASCAGNGIQLQVEYQDPAHPELRASVTTAK